MNIIVTGCKDPIFEQHLLSATRFFGKELLSKKMLPYIDIEIVMKSKMKDLGSCMVSYYNDWYQPREFEIELRKYRTLKLTLLTLAHEMVHLKQFAKKELNCDQTRWMGKSFNSEDVSYHDYPWEVEATSMEYVLYGLYQDYIKGE